MADEKKPTTYHDEYVEAHQGENLIVTQGVNKRLALINLWNLLGPMSTGFTAAVIAASFIQPELIAYFALATRPNANIVIGCMASSFNMGAAIGLIVTGELSDRFGRKKAYLFNCIAYFIGVALTCGSQNVIMFCFGRVFTGFGGWANMLAAVTYGSEISTPKRRGVFGGGFGVALTFGYVLAGWTTVGMFYSTSVFAWRAPLLIQLLFPALIVCGLPFVPESPRWLALKGRDDEVLEVLKGIHHSKHDPEFIVAREEHFQICSQAAVDRTLPSSWWAMFTTYWKRTAATIMVTAGNQSTGIQFCTNYNGVLFASLGFTGVTPSSYKPAGSWLLSSPTSSGLRCSTKLDVGRSSFLQPPCTTAVMAVIVGLYATYANTTDIEGLRVLAAMVFVLVFIFSMDEPAEFVFIAEIFPTHVRTKGIALGCASIMLTGVWLTLSAPTGIATIGWKYFLIFVVLGVFYSFAQYPFIKETKGVPLEEIDAIFGDGNNVAIYSKEIVIDSAGVHAVGGGAEKYTS